jgi:hypothetical protein
MSVLINLILSLVDAYLPWVNPRCVEFVCHYIGGSQTPMCLTEDEEYATWCQVLDSLLWEDDNEEWRYNHVTGKGWVPCPNGEWLTHITMGLVGGFCFTTSWEEVDGETFLVAHCHDEWDFNPNSLGGGGARLSLPDGIPSAKLFAVRAAARAVGVRISLDAEGPYVYEEDLVRFNEKHRFSTDWKLYFHPQRLTCPI